MLSTTQYDSDDTEVLAVVGNLFVEGVERVTTRLKITTRKNEGRIKDTD